MLNGTLFPNQMKNISIIRINILKINDQTTINEVVVYH